MKINKMLSCFLFLKVDGGAVSLIPIPVIYYIR